MFSLRKFKDWRHTSINDDKLELDIYQIFNEQFSSIDNQFEEYLKELGNEDKRLFVKYNGNSVPINRLYNISQIILNDKDLSIKERAYQSAELYRLYLLELKNLKEKIITLSVANKDNVYLSCINSCVGVLNKLLQKYSYLLAVQRSDIYSIDNHGDLNAGKKIKKLKDNIEIRSNEIKCRLTLDDLERKK